MHTLLLEKNWRPAVSLKKYILARMPGFSVETNGEDSPELWLRIAPPKKTGFFAVKNYHKLENRLLNLTVEYVLLECPKDWIGESLMRKYGYDRHSARNGSEAQLIYEGVCTRVKDNVARNKRSNVFTRLRRRARESTDDRGRLSVGAFVRFRVGEYKRFVEEETDRILEKIGGELKYMEFIRALQSLIDSRRPKMREIRVLVNETDYIITDEYGHAIRPELYESAKKDGVAKDDLLIGLLIVAAPLRIVIQAPDSFLDSALFSTLSNIFGDRVIVSI